jgi:hypothetical protein
VYAHLVLVHHGILLLGVTFRALAGRAYESRGRLLRFNSRPRAIDEKGGHDQSERDHDRDEDWPERHDQHSTGCRNSGSPLSTALKTAGIEAGITLEPLLTSNDKAA